MRCIDFSGTLDGYVSCVRMEVRKVGAGPRAALNPSVSSRVTSLRVDVNLVFWQAFKDLQGSLTKGATSQLLNPCVKR